MKDRNGMTPLMVADRARIAELLIRHHADLDLRDKQGKTALLHMINEQAYEISAILLQEKANPDSTDDHGNTAARIIKDKYRSLVSCYYCPNSKPL